MNTTIDLKTAKTIEAMNQKINHMDNAVTCLLYTSDAADEL